MANLGSCIKRKQAWHEPVLLAGGEELSRAARVLRGCLRPAAAKASPEVAVAAAHLLSTAAQHHPSLVDLLCFPTSLAAEHPPGKVQPRSCSTLLLCHPPFPIVCNLACRQQQYQPHCADRAELAFLPGASSSPAQAPQG